MDTFRKRLYRAFRHYRAVHVLLNSPSPDELNRLGESLENIEFVPARQLREKAKDFKKAYDEVVERYGVRGTPEQFEVLQRDLANATMPIVYVAKAELVQLFRNYENLFPEFGRLPPHGRVGIDIGGRRAPRNAIEIFLLEASLFEDMATLWNEAAAAANIAGKASSTVAQKKLAGALSRAVAKAAFSLLEGYLNGLALDTQLLRAVPLADQIKLEEWDDLKNRPVFLTLRDKILQYVKIAAASEHPPIQESNSVPMTRVLDLESKVRHALIHPTPRYAPRSPVYREQVYSTLSTEEVRDLCDNVVLLIRQIANAVGGDFGDVEFWLFDRNQEGTYDESTFT